MRCISHCPTKDSSVCLHFCSSNTVLLHNSIKCLYDIKFSNREQNWFSSSNRIRLHFFSPKSLTFDFGIFKTLNTVYQHPYFRHHWMVIPTPQTKIKPFLSSKYLSSKYASSSILSSSLTTLFLVSLSNENVHNFPPKKLVLLFFLPRSYFRHTLLTGPGPDLDLWKNRTLDLWKNRTLDL